MWHRMPAVSDPPRFYTLSCMSLVFYPYESSELWVDHHGDSHEVNVTDQIPHCILRAPSRFNGRTFDFEGVATTV